jgi:hypothetical protein
MYITRALIGRNLCLDQAIQTRKFKGKGFLKWNFNTESCYFIKQLLYGFRIRMAWSKHLGMLLELEKRAKSLAFGSCFARFFNSRNIPARLDQAIQTRKP